MKFIDKNGQPGKGRRFSSTAISFLDDQLSNVQKLGEVLRSLSSRLIAVESKLPPEPVELEREVSFGGVNADFYHGFNSPVRWYVVDWAGATSGLPTTAPILVRDVDRTTENLLSLKSYTQGKVVLRIEPSQYTTTKVR